MSLKLDEGDWCTDHSILRDATTSFFRGLFDADTAPPLPFPITGMFPQIPISCLDHLFSPPLESEIKDALFAMSPLKAPCLDGLHAHFYQEHLDIVGPSVCSLIQSFFRGEALDPSVNSTGIVLFLKAYPLLAYRSAPNELSEGAKHYGECYY
ncbi:hypothetical protein V6N11_079658 [Hibiscus sabdariffa]|uniref:BTB domain-containing protein n=2 Tax=Hibiscus sabdariffa TaxID=183260 RepID=A0ABR2RW60_9ROSI